MASSAYRKIVLLVTEAFRLGRSNGIPNLLQPGLVKEMMIADQLGHVLIVTKGGADAHKVGHPDVLYEYLSCKEGGSGQLDRMFKEPPAQRKKSMARIERNKMIYYAVFDADDQISLKVIYEIEPRLVAKEAKRQLDKSRNEISHIGFSNRWARENGRIVYKKPGQ